MPIFSPDDWRPVGVKEIEPTAGEVVRSAANTLVVAGPGAGKTELLAQRANFLLTTNACKFPKRILAISFKRDAAKNLAERVQERTGELASRFDSMTLDAFAKQLVDRFYPALPADWRPKENYLVRTTGISEQDSRDWFRRAIVPHGFGRPNMDRLSKQEIAASLDKVMHGAAIPFDQGTSVVHQAWAKQWWQEQLALPIDKPSLTFPMLNRLAGHLLRTNPKIVRILRATYSHVFLDEFQDTTPSQWDLIRSAFEGAATVLTAVGDSKQRIMVFAGADPEIFDKYRTTFGAELKQLVRNYRSVPELVEIQHAIAQVVEAGTQKAEAAKQDETTGACRVLAFDTPQNEADYLASYIRDGLSAGLKPRDFCVLTRQLTGAMIVSLQQSLTAMGIAIRDETALQDLLVEPITKVVLHSLRLGSTKRDSEAWSELGRELSFLSGLDEDEDSVALERLTIAHKDWADAFIRAGSDIRTFPSGLLDLVGKDRYRNVYRQYMNGNYLERIAETLGAVLAECLQKVGNIKGIVDEFSGKNTVPAMSIHKSKGLEFKVVIFIGVEDEQWWNFGKQPDEEKRAFFVAFSRAIEKVLFTYSKVRPKWGRDKVSNFSQVGTLLEVLKKAGVATEAL